MTNDDASLPRARSLADASWRKSPPSSHPTPSCAGHRKLIAAKWTYPSNRIGRPGVMKAIRKLIVRFATDNSSWGYCRIQGELRKLDHRVAPSTIAKTLKEHGIQPAPQRPTSWRTFLV